MNNTSNWPIFRPNIFHEPNEILNEFEMVAEGLVGPVFSDKLAWNGVCVFHEKENIWEKTQHKINLDNLPKLKKFIKNYFDLDRVRMINVYKLEPGACLHPHRDMEGNLILGMIRVHYCLKTNPECMLLGEHLKSGHFLSFSTSELHNAENLGETDRIHLVVDIKTSAKNNKFFPKLTLNICIKLVDRTIRIFLLLLRDVLKRPSSVISRIKSLIKK